MFAIEEATGTENHANRCHRVSAAQQYGSPQLVTRPAKNPPKLLLPPGEHRPPRT